MSETLTPEQEIEEIDLVLLESVVHLKEQRDPKEIGAWLNSIDELLEERVTYMRKIGWKPERRSKFKGRVGKRKPRPKE